MKQSIGVLLLVLVFVFLSRIKFLASSVYSNAGMASLTNAIMQTGEKQPKKAQYVFSLEQFRRAAELNIQNSRSSQWMGYIFLSLGMESKALDLWSHAADQMTGECVRWGWQRYNIKDYSGALIWYDRAKTISAKSGDPYYFDGLTYMEMGKPNNALDSFQQSLLLRRVWFGQSDVYYQIAMIFSEYISPPDLDSAENALSKAISTNDFRLVKPINAHYARGLVLVRLERFSEAIEDFYLVIDQNPTHYAATRRLGDLVWTVDRDFNEAERLLKKAIQLAPNRKAAILTLAEIYEETGLITKADEMYRKALIIDSQCERAITFFDEKRNK